MGRSRSAVYVLTLVTLLLFLEVVTQEVANKTMHAILSKCVDMVSFLGFGGFRFQDLIAYTKSKKYGVVERKWV